MPKFTVRIELHYGRSQDYQEMEEELEKVGMRDVMEGPGGVQLRMPSGEYHYEGEDTPKQVVEKAKRCAEVTKRKSAILVTQLVQRAWDGLEELRRR